MGCNLGIGKVCLSTHDPVGRIIGVRTHGRLMNFSVELCRIIICFIVVFNLVVVVVAVFVNIIVVVIVLVLEL